MEANGSLALHAERGQLVSGPGGQALTVSATFSTNIVPTDGVNGLKSNHGFSVTGVFSLLDNTAPGDVYGIRLSDRDAQGNLGLAGSQQGNDVLELVVVHLASGERAVQFRRQDFITGALTVISPFTLDDTEFVLDRQIALTLDRDNSASGITAYFAFDSGSRMTFAQTADIFQGENWTRAEFMASQLAPIPEPETYALLLAGLALVGWRLRMKRHAAARLA